MKGCRHAALIAVLYGAGVRRREVVAKDLEDWNRVDYCSTVRRGKGDNDQLLTRMMALLLLYLHG